MAIKGMNAFEMAQAQFDKVAVILDLARVREVGRAVGRLNRVLPKRQFILMGPGRYATRTSRALSQSNVASAKIPLSE